MIKPIIRLYMALVLVLSSSITIAEDYLTITCQKDCDYKVYDNQNTELSNQVNSRVFYLSASTLTFSGSGPLKLILGKETDVESMAFRLNGRDVDVPAYIKGRALYFHQVISYWDEAKYLASEERHSKNIRVRAGFGQQGTTQVLTSQSNISDLVPLSEFTRTKNMGDFLNVYYLFCRCYSLGQVGSFLSERDPDSQKIWNSAASEHFEMAFLAHEKMLPKWSQKERIQAMTNTIQPMTNKYAVIANENFVNSGNHFIGTFLEDDWEVCNYLLERKKNK